MIDLALQGVAVVVCLSPFFLLSLSYSTGNLFLYSIEKSMTKTKKR